MDSWTVINYYDQLRCFRSNHFSYEEIDVTANLKKFFRDGSGQLPLRIIFFERGRGWINEFRRARPTNGTCREIFCDIHNGNNFLLWSDEYGALAIIGFIRDGSHEIRILQIQGVLGKRKQLKGFRWEKMLVQVVIDWAKDNEIQVVKIQKARYNNYYNKCLPDTGGRNSRLYMRYDVTARRMGFKNDGEYFYALQISKKASQK